MGTEALAEWLATVRGWRALVSLGLLGLGVGLAAGAGWALLRRRE